MTHFKAAPADNNNNTKDDGATAEERLTSPLLKRRHASQLVPGDAGGLEAYRRWLTRVRTPQTRRAPLDPSLYTWKGYRNWSEKVRREWKPED